MSEISRDRKRAVRELDTSLSQTGGFVVFTAQSARNLMLAVSELETKIKKWAGPSALSNDGRINGQQLQKTVNKPDIMEWLALAIDVVHRAARQLGGTVELESNVNQLRETNMCLVTDQKLVQARMIEKKNTWSSHQFKKLQ